MVYVYANTHKYAYGNLKYFIETAVRERDGVDYIFILQRVGNKEINETEMPSLPKQNAFYIQHDNECFDYGTVGWFFHEYTISNFWKQSKSTTIDNKNYHRKFDISRYKYFIFMNASIRGPFFPPYFLKFLLDYQKEFNEPFYWYYIFTKRINSKVKLVGCTISCPKPQHVQSYFVVTDIIGLSILVKSDDTDGSPRTGIFGCHASLSDDISISELGMSSRILESGYTIDSLLTIYQYVDFSKTKNDECTIYGNPYGDKNMEGTSLEPYEVVFVKHNNKKGTTDAQQRAELYQRWMEDVKIQNRSSW